MGIHRSSTSINHQTHLTPDLSTLAPEPAPTMLSAVKQTDSMVLPRCHITHHPQAGLNPLADAASHLLSMAGKLKHTPSYRSLHRLQQTLIQEINLFQTTIKNHGYHAEYSLICRYVLCALFDDMIPQTPWGNQNQWEAYSLLNAYEQHTNHQDKCFTILERALKEPSLYIDLMELMYLCLSLGYKGRYRATEHSQYQLEQITDHLYHQIRAHRGHFNKTLSPTPIKLPKIAAPLTRTHHPSPLLVLLATICLIIAIFAGLSYLLDTLSNEAYPSIHTIENTVSRDTI
jgi:type VI secretion system protein ImpK